MILRDIAVGGLIIGGLLTGYPSKAETPWKPLPPPPASTAFPPVSDNAATPPTIPAKSESPAASSEVKNEPESQIPPLYRVVDAVDLYVGPRKYLGKNIEVRKVRCYFADVDDYRCITDDPLVVFSRSVEPKSVRQWIEDNCDQIRKLPTAKCLFAIRFSFDADDVSEDIISGYQKRMIIRPAAGITVSYAQDQPRRRR